VCVCVCVCVCVKLNNYTGVGCHTIFSFDNNFACATFNGIK
jgi:hypothetical protein